MSKKIAGIHRLPGSDKEMAEVGVEPLPGLPPETSPEWLENVPENDDIVLNCRPVKYGPTPVLNATTIPCTLCKQDCHLAPSSKVLVDKYPTRVKIVCMDCLDTWMQSGDA